MIIGNLGLGFAVFTITYSYHWKISDALAGALIVYIGSLAIELMLCTAWYLLSGYDLSIFPEKNIHKKS